MENFAERLKSTFATLVRPLTPEDGQPEASISVAEARLGLRLPAVLRKYYLLTGRLDRFNRAHNQLRRPKEWSVDRGKLVFLEENQCVVFWGVEAGKSPEDDPPVYQGQNVRGQPTEWYLEHERCSEFLIVMLHLQAVWGTLHHMGPLRSRPANLRSGTQACHRAEADLIRNILGIAEIAGLDEDELGYLLGKVAEARKID